MTRLIVFAALAVAVFAQPGPRELFERARMLDEGNRNLAEAIRLYGQVVDQARQQRALAAEAQFRVGVLHERLGRKDEAQRAYRAVVAGFADQTEIAARARAKLGAAAPNGVVVRQVWAERVADTLGAPSPDGRFISFVDWQTGDLAVRELATGERRRLTNKGSWTDSIEFAMHSVPSPDGKLIAYGWFNTAWTYDLRLVSLDGSMHRVLYAAKDVDWLQPADWTPDGKSVLAMISHRDGTRQLALVPVAGGGLQVLRSSDWQLPQRARISPDGRYVVCDVRARRESPASDILLMRIDGSGVAPLVEHPADDLSPEWTVDGSRILFGSDRTGQMSVWSLKVASGKAAGEPELIKSDIGRNAVVMGLTRKGSFYYGLQTGMQEVYIAEMDPVTGRIGTPKPATQRFVGSNVSPAWSPDGRKLAYISRRQPATGIAAICIRSIESGQERELTPEALTRIGWLRWFPDGSALLTLGRDAAGNGFFRIDLTTGQAARIEGKPVDTWLGWPAAISTQGNRIFHYRHDPEAKTSLILSRDLRTGVETPLYAPAAQTFFGAGLALSPDERLLAFVTNGLEKQSGLLVWVVPASGGEARPVLRLDRNVGISSIAWTADGRHLLYTRSGETNPALWRVGAEGGEPQSLGLTMPALRHLSVHPDGRRIAFTAGESKSEVWVMENFLAAGH